MSNPLSEKIEHIVVLMLENRSFDNLLGWLYDPSNEPPFNVVPDDFDGLSGKDLSNLAPDGSRIRAGKSHDARGPQPNPGEPFEEVYSQVFNVPKVEFKHMDVSKDPPRAANMQGFVNNYAIQEHVGGKYAKIMHSLTPATLPVLASLAHHYAVCDRWFASIPTQTFCNRSFLHAGTSSGYVDNGGAGLCFVNDTPTIFDLLQEAGKSWTIYHGGWLLQSFTLLTQKRLWPHALGPHFAHFNQFLDAAKRKGGLPNYSFIEPIYFDSTVWGPENDMHPECNPYEFYGPSNLHRGEALLAKVYDAVRNSPDWESTLLIVLFDEHGGCYDHVPPPTAGDGCEVAIAPDARIIPAGQPGGVGFRFDRLGVRVPAIFISAYTPPQIRLHQIFEHTSVLSTVVNCFGLPEERLGARQQKAPDVADALRLSEPRTDRPPIAAPKVSAFDDFRAEVGSIFQTLFQARERTPITDLQTSALHGVAQFLGRPEMHEHVEQIQHELAADKLLADLEPKFRQGRITRRE